jgi:hypothetical protein
MLHGCECLSGAAKLLHCCHLLCCTANFMPHIQTCIHPKGCHAHQPCVALSAAPSVCNRLHSQQAHQCVPGGILTSSEGPRTSSLTCHRSKPWRMYQLLVSTTQPDLPAMLTCMSSAHPLMCASTPYSLQRRAESQLASSTSSASSCAARRLQWHVGPRWPGLARPVLQGSWDACSAL